MCYQVLKAAMLGAVQSLHTTECLDQSSKLPSWTTHHNIFKSHTRMQVGNQSLESLQWTCLSNSSSGWRRQCQLGLL